MSAGELATEAMDDKGFDPAASDTRRDFVHRFGMTLHDLLRQKTVAKDRTRAGRATEARGEGA